MDARKEQLLHLLIEEFIRTAEPVGSKFLAEASGLNVSPATVRNELAALEREGFIRQPHTSAGRVPTEMAYLHYLQNVVEPSREKARRAQFKGGHGTDGEEALVKTLAKELVELSGEMAVVAFDPRWSFYTGVANLLQKPDFRELSVIHSLSSLIDRFDDVLAEMFDAVPDDARVMIGSANPFGEDMSAVMVRYALPSGHTGILGLVGPMRMDYGKNIRLIEEARNLLNAYE